MKEERKPSRLDLGVEDLKAAESSEASPSSKSAATLAAVMPTPTPS